MPANLKNSAVATGLEKFSFHSNPKERQCQRMLKLPHNCTHLSSVHSVMSDSLLPHVLQHIRPACPSPTPGVYPNSCSLSWWCHPTISSSVNSFSSCLQLSQHQGLFKWVSSWASGGQSIGVSALASNLPKNIQDYFPLGWTGWISLLISHVGKVMFKIIQARLQ